MTDHERATPRPWKALTTGSEGCSIVAANVRTPRVARLTNADLPMCQADAALIVEAVNNYDRLLRIEAAARNQQLVIANLDTLGATEASEADDLLRSALSEPSS